MKKDNKMIKLNRKQIRILLEQEVKAKLNPKAAALEDTIEELEDILESYDSFLDGAEDWADKNNMSQDAAIGYIKGRLETLVSKGYKASGKA